MNDRARLVVASRWLRAALAIALLLTTGLAGCLSEDGDDRDLEFSSYEEARAAEGTVYAPDEPGRTVRLKLIEPLEPDAQVTGQQRVLVLLFDTKRDAPQREVDLVLEARHDELDRGTSPERDPRPQGYGVYEGFTTFDEPGPWTMTLDATLPGGTTVTFRVPVHVR